MKKQRNYIGIIALMCTAMFASCEKMQDVEMPSVVTGEATNVKSTEVVMNATFTLEGERSINARRAFEMSNSEETLTSNQYYYDDDWTELSGSTTISALMNSLSPGTTYYYRAVLFPKNSDYSAPVYGNVVSFTTEESTGPVISLTLNEIISITSCTSRTTGTYNVQKCTMKKLGMLVGKNSTPTISSYTKRFTISFEDAVSSDFWANMYNLNPSTVYYLRAYAIDENSNVYYSNVRSFTTKSEPGGPLTVNDFIGTFTLNAYSPWESKNVTLTNVQIRKYNNDTVYAVGIMNSDGISSENFRAIGIFDQGRQIIRFEHSWYWESCTFTYNGKTCVAEFYPSYYNTSDQAGYYIEDGGRYGKGEIWLKKTGTSSYSFVASDGDSRYGLYANGFIFDYNTLSPEWKNEGNSYTYTNVTLTRTSTSTSSNVPERGQIRGSQILKQHKQLQYHETENINTAVTR